MHRDFKLGLALTVLLVGAVSAFFFRNEVDPNKGLPKLQNPQQLDDQLALRSNIPYLPPQDHSHDPAVALGPIFEEEWGHPVYGVQGSITGVSRAQNTLVPIPLSNPETELPAIAVPLAPQSAGTLATGKPAGTLATGIPATGRPATGQPAIGGTAGRMHVVMPGDTLTGIAKQYLGSITRYDEIFQLNRDRLKGPDDLRIGMTLKIPPADPAGMLHSDSSSPTDPHSRELAAGEPIQFQPIIPPSLSAPPVDDFSESHEAPETHGTPPSVTVMPKPPVPVPQKIESSAAPVASPQPAPAKPAAPAAVEKPPKTETLKTETLKTPPAKTELQKTELQKTGPQNTDLEKSEPAKTEKLFVPARPPFLPGRYRSSSPRVGSKDRPTATK